MKYIPLTLGKRAIVDDELFDMLSQYKWNAIRCGQKTAIYYAVRGIMVSKNKQQRIWMHHVVIGYPLNKKVVDHRNRNSLDNQKNNLRIVDQRANTSNRSFPNGKHSKFTGVTWNKCLRYWVSQITIKGKAVHLGYFKNEKTAAISYQNKLKEINNAATATRV